SLTLFSSGGDGVCEKPAARLGLTENDDLIVGLQSVQFGRLAIQSNERARRWTDAKFSTFGALHDKQVGLDLANCAGDAPFGDDCRRAARGLRRSRCNDDG